MAKIRKYASSNPQELKQDLKDYSDKKLRSLYEKRVTQAQKQINRIKGKYGERASTSSVQKLPSSGSNLTREQMLKGLSESNRYLKSKISTLGGYKDMLKKEQEAFDDKDMHFSKKELVDVNYYLDQLRADNIGSLFPSDFIQEIAKKASKKGFTYEQLKNNLIYFYENQDRLDRFYLKANRKGSSSDDYKG